ncbi:hypothetical protein Tco_1443754, partial [Tanacetum coccineum]
MEEEEVPLVDGVFEGALGALGFGNGSSSGCHGGLWWLIMDEEDDELVICIWREFIGRDLFENGMRSNLPCNRIKAIQELTRGKQLTNTLREMLGPQQEKIDESDHLKLADTVVAMFDNTLSILSNSYTFNEKPHDIQTHDQRFKSSTADDHDSGESEKSTVRSVKIKRGCYKR